MRRHLLWYGIAACWALAGAIGILLHHARQATPALIFAAIFAAIGYWIGKRDASLRQRRMLSRKDI